MPRRGCGCCGCEGLECQLRVASRDPVTVICYVKQTVSESTWDEITTLTYEDGYVISRVTENTDPVVVGPTISEYEDEQKIAGKFSRTSQDIGPYVIDDQRDGGDGIITYTRTYTEDSTEIERRLILEFTVNDVYAMNPGWTTLKEARFVTRVGRWYHETNSSQLGYGNTVKGIYADESPLPADSGEFDTLYAAAENTETITANSSTDDYSFSITDWNISSYNNSNTFTFLLYDEDRGWDMSGIMLTFSHRTVGDFITFDDCRWEKSFDTDAPGRLELKDTLPEKDFEVQYDVGQSWFADNEHTHKFELLDPDDHDTTLFEAEFKVWGNPYPIYYNNDIFGNPTIPVYEHFIQSEGTAGTLIHSRVESVTEPGTGDASFYYDLEVYIKIRQGVVEIGRINEAVWLDSEHHRVHEDGEDVDEYEFFPYWDEQINNEKGFDLRMTWLDENGLPTKNPDIDAFRWTQLNLPLDEEDMDCPDGTCQWFRPHAHPQWRLKSYEVSSALNPRSMLDWETIEHEACLTCMTTVEGDPPETNDYVGHSGSRVSTRDYSHPSISTVYGLSVGLGHINLPSGPNLLPADGVFFGWTGPSIFVGQSIYSPFNVGYNTQNVYSSCAPPVLDYKPITTYAAPSMQVSATSSPTVSETKNRSIASSSPIVYRDSDEAKICVDAEEPYPSEALTLATIQYRIDNLILTFDEDQPYSYVYTGIGKGLLFGWEDGAPDDFSNVADDFVALFQLNEPEELGADLTPAEINEITTTLAGSSAVYWYGWDEEWYSIDSSGQQGPFEEHTWTDRPEEVGVILTMEYTYWTRLPYTYPDSYWPPGGNNYPEYNPYVVFAVLGNGGFGNDGLVITDDVTVDYPSSLPPEIGALVTNFWPDTLLDCKAVTRVDLFSDSNYVLDTSVPTLPFPPYAVAYTNLSQVPPDQINCPPFQQDMAPSEATQIDQWYDEAVGTLTSSATISESGETHYITAYLNQVVQETNIMRWRQIITPSPDEPELTELAFDDTHLTRADKRMYLLDRVEFEVTEIEETSFPTQIPGEMPPVPTDTCDIGSGPYPPRFNNVRSGTYENLQTSQYHSRSYSSDMTVVIEGLV